jgi:hypothetical protein
MVAYRLGANPFCRWERYRRVFSISGTKLS